MEVKVIGAGLAGCEAAWQLAKRGIGVRLYEMKPQKMSPAHHSQDFAELVCSNSLRGDRLENAVGLLKEELRRCDSLIMQCAEATRVEAGGCLAVDRKGFSQLVTEKIRSNPLITVVSEEVTQVPEGPVIIATGPLTSDALSKAIGEYFGTDYLHFFDAAAPLVTAESVDMDLAWWQSRYDRGTPDYVNCAMDKQQYEAFVKELISAEEAEVQQRKLDAEVRKQADAELYRRQKEAEAQKYEAERAAEAAKFAKQQEAEGIALVGKAEAEAIRQKGLAEAEAMKQKAEAYKQYNDAAVAEMMIKVLPEIARSVAQPLSSIDKVSIIGGDASGVSGVSGNVPVLMAQTMEAMKEATGIDMRDIVRANSIEAKTDRNITIKTEPEGEE